MSTTLSPASPGSSFYTDAMPIVAIRKREIPPGEVSQVTIMRTEAYVVLTEPVDPSKRGLYVVSNGHANFHHAIEADSSHCPVDLEKICVS